MTESLATLVLVPLVALKVSGGEAAGEVLQEAEAWRSVGKLR